MLKSSATKAVLVLAAVCAFSVHPTKLSADAITWEIAGGTQMAGMAGMPKDFVSGWFTYDSTTNTYTDVDIVVSDDPNPIFTHVDVPGDTYATSDLVGDSSSTFLDLLDTGTGTEFQLYFEDSLTDDVVAGVDPTGIHLLTDDGATLADYENPGSIPFNTSVYTTPEPGTLLLLGSGLLAVARRLRTK
jgi:hypothetical protein